MKLVNQKTNWDCGYAALAMFLDISYQDVEELVKEYAPTCAGKALSDREVIRILANKGLTPIQAISPIYRVGVPEIAVVASLNFPGRLHYVVLSGQSEVFDPQNGREGKKFFGDLDSMSDAAAGSIFCLEHLPDNVKIKLNACGTWTHDYTGPGLVVHKEGYARRNSHEVEIKKKTRD